MRRLALALSSASMHDLGVTNPAMLARASAIDQLSEQLILGASHLSEQGKEGLDAFSLSRSTGSAELINHILASGSPHLPSLRALSPSALPSTHRMRIAPPQASDTSAIRPSQEPQAEAEP